MSLAERHIGRADMTPDLTARVPRHRWHAPQHAPVARLTLIPPPPKPPPLQPGVLAPSEWGVCGVCHSEPNDPTATPSGFIFCAACVQDAVARDGACPLSGMPMTLPELCRVYETSRAPAPLG